MANRDYLNLEDEIKDEDDAPYSSVSTRSPLEDLSAQGRADDLLGTDEDDDRAPASSNPMRDAVMSKMASSKGGPAPTPTPMPNQSPPALAASSSEDDDSNDYSKDPLMKQYEGKEKELQAYRQAMMHSNYITNLGQAAAQAAQGANTPVQDNSLFKNIGEQNKELVKGNEGDLDRRQKIVNAIEMRKSREGVASDNRDARAQNAQMMAQAAGQRASDRADDKLGKQVDTWTRNMKDDLDPNKARGGNLASNQKRVDNADRVQALLAQVHNNPDPRQMEELAISTQSLLSASGTPAAEQVKALIPKTAMGDVNKFKEWLINDPTGTGQQAFVARMAETVSREKEVANNQVQKAQRARLSAYGKFKNADPDTYNSILNSYGLGEDSKPVAQAAAPSGSGKAGQMVKVKGKLYKIGADGDSLEEVM